MTTEVRGAAAPEVGLVPEADLLLAEAIGLLLEPLGLDDTMSGAESLALMENIAALSSSPVANTKAIQAEVIEHLALAVSGCRAREAFAAEARERGLDPDESKLEAAQRILQRTPAPKMIARLANLPAEAASVTLHEFELTFRKIKKASQAVREAWKAIEHSVRPSLLTDVDLATEALALRDRSWFFGWWPTGKSDAARGRVKEHLAGHLRDLSAGEMADILNEVSNYAVARNQLQTLVSYSHEWADWAVDTRTGSIRLARVASLRWLLTEAETGNFTTLERSLLTTNLWRRILTHQTGTDWSIALATEPSSRTGRQPMPGITAALDRLSAWLNEPSVVPLQHLAAFAGKMSSSAHRIAAALLVCEEATAYPAISTKVREAVQHRQGPFGPADTNRTRFRAILDRHRDNLDQVHQVLEPLRPQHPKLVALIGELREANGLMIRDLRTPAPARGPLRVAIAGRTKAGKTTLRKVLTRDLTEEGIGRGAHRTTRTADVFAWDRTMFVDTPGVSAKDDDFDAATAVQACLASDAVVWMFAESLHEEEAKILQSLLAIKPVLMVYNAKMRVDSPRRLEMFARSPHLAFGDLTSHSERTTQMAGAAGVRDPIFIAGHVSAARRALVAHDESHPAWEASGIRALESDLRRVLTSQTQGLRSLRLADQVRTPVTVAKQRAGDTVRALEARYLTFEHRLIKEERELRRAVSRAVERARGEFHRNLAAAKETLQQWLGSVDGRADSMNKEWIQFLEGLDVDAMLQGIADRVAEDTRRNGLLLDREDRLEERLQEHKMRLADARRGVNLFARIWRVLTRLTGLFSRNAYRFRAEASAGPPGWAVMALDVLATTGAAVSDEVKESRIERKDWERNAGQASRSELDRIGQRVASELSKIETALLKSIDDHLAQARTDVSRIGEVLEHLRRFQAKADASIAEIDLLTVERLLRLGKVERVRVVSVDREPNLRLDVIVDGDPTLAARCLSTVLDGCSSEAVTVTRAHKGNRRTRRRRQ